ncbi:MAG: carbohydrate-binding family 9-like protein [Phycisphaerales bacterium]
MKEPTPQVRRRYLCRRVAGGIEIDGDLGKSAWSAATWTEDFVDIEGSARPIPRWRTRAKMLWDDECLYIAAEMEEPDLWATLTERDSVIFHDNDFEVFLNPTGDSHQYYELEVNALNTVWDLFLPKPYKDGGQADNGWDAVGLRTAVRLEGTLNDPRDRDRGWTVEMALPWRCFDRHDDARGGRAPREGEQWRVNFSRVEWDLEVVEGESGRREYRKVAGRPEYNWVWSPQGVIDMHRPEMWGYVQFGGGAFEEDAAAAARERLHAVWYAQRRHKEAAGRWGEAGEIGVAGVTLEMVGEGWRAWAEFVDSLGTRRRAWISEDARAWVE